MDEDYSLLTSTRYDPFLKSCRWNDDDQGPSPFFLLPCHHERFLKAAEAHNWPSVQSEITYPVLKAACSDAVSAQLGTAGDGALRLRITISKQGPVYISIDTVPVPGFSSDPTLPSLFDPLSPSGSDPLPSPMRLYLDTEPTHPSIFTRTKTTYRHIYNLPKKRNENTLKAVPAGIDSDIIIYNQHQEIMETTIFNIAFYRDSKWITPPTTSGCLPGVMRRWLLEHDRVKEGHLTTNAISQNEWVLLFNGVQGCRIGRLYSPVKEASAVEQDNQGS